MIAMSTRNSELFTFIGAAFCTAGALFAAQVLYGACIDISYHAKLNAAGPNQAAAAARTEQLAKLAAGRMPLEAAKQRLAQQGRDGFASIAPVASDDLSAVAGWIHHPSFKPVVAHPIRTPRVVPVEPPAEPAASVQAAPAAAAQISTTAKTK